MENIEITSMSSRGQIVIPQGLRERLKLNEGEKFIVIGQDNTIVLKKVEMPSKEKLLKELSEIAKKAAERAEKLGVREEDVPNLVHNLRKEKKS
jgi:antitoxin PrlF